jgi:hypothetical protein
MGSESLRGILVRGARACAETASVRRGSECPRRVCAVFKSPLANRSGRMSGTHQGDLDGIPATGKQLEWTGVSLWEFDGGKARRGWIFSDAAGLMGQLGVA